MYVIQSWQASNEPVDEAMHLVAIHGRTSGLVSWLLTRLGISPNVSLEISAASLQVRQASLSGSAQRTVPLEHCCATTSGCHRPWREAAILFGTTVLVSSWCRGWAPPALPLVLTCAGLILAIGYYLLNESVTVGFTELSGHTTTVRFRRGVVAGEVIDEASAAYVSDLVQALIENRKAACAAATP